MAAVKESACQCRRCQFDPWARRIPWRRNDYPLQYSCLENFMDRGTWRAIQSTGVQRVGHNRAHRQSTAQHILHLILLFWKDTSVHKCTWCSSHKAYLFLKINLQRLAYPQICEIRDKIWISLPQIDFLSAVFTMPPHVFSLLGTVNRS